MVAIMAMNSREKIAALLKAAKLSADIPSKLDRLHQLREVLQDAESVLLAEFLSPLLDLVFDHFSPARRYVIEMISSIGLKHAEFLPEIAPALTTVLKDDTPAVVRQAIKYGIDIFRQTLVKVAVQGLYSSELDNSLETSWALVLKFRHEIFDMAFQPGRDGRKVPALKFIESMILLYTPDPNISSEPPAPQKVEGSFEEFNISWLRRGHPMLNAGDLSIEASQSLGLLLDQLRFPMIQSLSNLTVIVLVNSLSAIALRRPAFYGRILPVLLGLDPSSYASKGTGVHHALKKAFLTCLTCSYPSAAPWRDRLVGALREMKAEGFDDQKLLQLPQNNGSLECKDASSVAQEETPLNKAADAPHDNSGKKRSGVQDNAKEVDDEVPGKRAKPTAATLEGSTNKLSCENVTVSSSSPAAKRPDGENGPVQQLVAMFGALVAQGEKAVGSLEILIASISADLLAEVVMANMRNLPPTRPKAERDEESLLNTGSNSAMAGTFLDFQNLLSLLSDIPSQSPVFPQNVSEMDARPSVSNEIEQPREREVHKLDTADVGYYGLNYSSEQAAPLGLSHSSSEDVPSVTESDSLVYASEAMDLGSLENEIPGLDSVARVDGLPEMKIFPSLASSEIDEASQEQTTSLGTAPLEPLSAMSTDRSEELNSKAAVLDVTSIISSTASSVGLSTHLLLPKISAPVVDLTDEQKDHLQREAFARIVDAYNQITIAGGSQVQFSVLAYLGAEFPLELDPWNSLKKHILSDYVNHEGHELTLRVLYRLFGEAEVDQDFLSSTSATSVYEMFLLTVAETLRHSFPASDKSLSRLLAEVPYLPKSIFKLLESLCCPGSGDKDEELHSGDRVTQGLSTVWSLILLRPPIRDACLKIALQSAVHNMEEVRMKAIRLVANKLFPLPSIAQQIEDFAKEMLLSVANVEDKTEANDNGSDIEPQKDSNDEKPSGEHTSASITKDTYSDIHQTSISESVSSTSIAEVQRCMLLYFALCTKKHSLLRQIFLIYNNVSKAVKQAIHNEIPKLVRTVGSSPQLLEIISDPSNGTENLLMQVLHTLTDGAIPSPELIATVRKLYETKVKNVEILIPVLSFLPKDEVLRLFPNLVNSPLDKFQAALSRILQGTSQSGPVLSPAEALIAIHGIDPDRDGIPLKKVTDACNTCFEQREIFTQQVLAKVLNQLVEQIPLPLLFMRTVLQAIGAFPSLVDFIMEILSRLVSKQIWKYPKLWVGFMKCALLTKPQSFSVLLQLPPAQLENALSRTPGLKAPLVVHASQGHIKSSLPRSILTVLGIVLDSQSSSQMQQSEAQTGDPGNLDREAVTENVKESSTAS